MSLHSDVPTPRRLAWRLRLRGGLIAAVCGAVLAVAGGLSPLSGGQGTHEQLGIPPCSFLSRTGWPCPGCGVTTSLAAVAHAQLALAWQAQPFGFVLFGALAAGLVVGAAELVLARPVISGLRPSVWWAVIPLAALLAGWACKAAGGYFSGQYPLQ